VEETGLAVETLGAAFGKSDEPELARDNRLLNSLERGVEWLMARTESSRMDEVAPIGFYFAKLWYYEKLYPLTFCVGGLGQATQVVERPSPQLAGLSAMRQDRAP
jgi:squalene-hopene/tetraprenyl-beta-curcumene cyclase